MPGPATSVVQVRGDGIKKMKRLVHGQGHTPRNGLAKAYSQVQVTAKLLAQLPKNSLSLSSLISLFILVSAQNNGFHCVFMHVCIVVPKIASLGNCLATEMAVVLGAKGSWVLLLDTGLYFNRMRAKRHSYSAWLQQVLSIC